MLQFAVVEGRIRLACAVFQPGAYMRDKGFSEMLLALLEHLLALLPNHALDGGKAFLRAPLLAVRHHQVAQGHDQRIGA